jgi:hypothetical protein
MYQYSVRIIGEAGERRRLLINQPDIYFAYMSASRLVSGTRWSIDPVWKAENLPDLIG